MADRTSSSITMAAARGTVMGVIADFAAYPHWATGVSSAEIVEQGQDGRARRVRFALNAGPIRDSYVLAYEWDGDSAVRWNLAEPGTMVTEMTGAYLLADAVLADTVLADTEPADTVLADTGPADQGPGTRVSYELAVGTRVPMLGMLKRRAEKTIVDTALRGLKARAEGMQGE